MIHIGLTPSLLLRITTGELLNPRSPIFMSPARFGALLVGVSLVCTPVSFSYAASQTAHTKIPQGENAATRETVRFAPLQTTQTSMTVNEASVSSAPSLGPNLIGNPSLETPSAASASLPDGWLKGGYGSSTRAYMYPVLGSGGAGTRAIGFSVSNYSSGDAKWYFKDVPVKGNTQYRFSDVSSSTASSIIDIRYTLDTGAFLYKDVLVVAPSTSFQTNTVTITTPTNAVSLTVFHLLKRAGTLTTDDYSLQEVTPAPPPESSQNLVSNGDFETPSASGTTPAGWNKGGYGSSTRTYTYPAPGRSGNGAKITISNYVSGDAKWYFDPIALSPGAVYRFSDSYLSDRDSIVTVQFQNTDGTHSYRDLATLPAASVWTDATFVFQMPATATKATVFHLIKGNGSLSIDTVTLRSQDTFATGAVTFRFDDGLASQYSIAAPKLDSAGFKGTFYIITHEMYDTGFPGYVSKANVQNLASRGHEIGAHTRTHAHLTTLSPADQQTEIAGSRQDILSWNVGPVLSFAYPFGEYDATTIQIVKDAGFSSAAATISGYVTPSSDHYQLEYQELRADVTLDQVKRWVDTAATEQTWLILAFHSVDTTSNFYNTTPDMFGAIVDYVKQKGIPVVTVSEGVQSM